MSQQARSSCKALKITVTAAYILSSSTALASTISETGSSIRTSAPRDFTLRDSDRKLVIDVYYGGEKLTEATVTIRGANVQFDQPAAVVSRLTGLVSPGQIEEQLSRFVPAHQALVCGSLSSSDDCGVLIPETVGIIFDEDSFRADLFINPALLEEAQRSEAVYLSPPEDDITLVSRYGATVSGDSRGGRALHLQNRTIVSSGALRLRSDSSLTTGSGPALESLAVEHDRNDWRFTGGLFWAPGGDLLGRRKILGAGVATQLDTRLNRRALLGTPIALHLQRSARVDVIIDGRLVSSRIYAPGNVLVDSSNLPDGSYPLVLRIQENGRPSREERQFFTKGVEVAPLGRPLYAAFAGLVADKLGDAGRTPFYEVSAAYRLNSAVGIDSRVFGTSDKAVLEAGLVAFTPVAKLRAAALLTTAGDYGSVVRAVSSGGGPVSFSVDLRKVVSKSDGPLLPTSKRRASFRDDVESGIGDQGSYTQGTGIVAARVHNALFRVTGLYRRSASYDPDYSVGASFEMPVKQTNRWNVVLQTDARKTSQEFQAFFGLRASLNHRQATVAAAGGFNRRSNGRDRFTGEVQAAVHSALGPDADGVGEVALGRDFEASYLRAGARIEGNSANVRGEVLQRFDEGPTQYAGSIDGGFAFGGGKVSWAGRQISDAAIAVSADGGTTGQKYEILVNDGARGVVRANETALVFVQPYESFKVRLRPLGDSLSSFDSSDKSVAMHPGRVSKLSWSISPTFVLFGRVRDQAGAVVANADVVGGHGIARTDEQGFFQIEARKGDELSVRTAAGGSCRISSAWGQPDQSFLAAGDLTCQ